MRAVQDLRLPEPQEYPVTVREPPESPTQSIRQVLAELTRSPGCWVAFLAAATLVGLLYTLLLTFAYTQSLSFANWHYLDGYLLAWSVGLGLAMGLVVAVQVFAIRRIRLGVGGALSGVGLVAAVLPSLACCSPLIPTLLAFAGLSGVGLYSTTGSLQHFFAVHETEFLAGSFAVLVVNAWWGLHRTARAACTDAEGCSTSDGSES